MREDVSYLGFLLKIPVLIHLPILVKFLLSKDLSFLNSLCPI